MKILAKEVNLSRSRFSGLDCKLPTDSQISICTNETIHIDDEVLLKTVELKTQKYQYDSSDNKFDVSIVRGQSDLDDNYRKRMSRSKQNTKINSNVKASPNDFRSVYDTNEQKLGNVCL